MLWNRNKQDTLLRIVMMTFAKRSPTYIASAVQERKEYVRQVQQRMCEAYPELMQVRETKRPRKQMRERDCLRCRRPFKSAWFGERVCPNCKPALNREAAMGIF